MELVVCRLAVSTMADFLQGWRELTAELRGGNAVSGRKLRSHAGQTHHAANLMPVWRPVDL